MNRRNALLRNMEIRAAVAAGETRKAVAARYGMSYANVARACEGLPRHVARALDGSRRRAGYELRASVKWGMSLDEYLAHVRVWGKSTNEKSPMTAFCRQRKGARKRGIAWEFTFPQWWKVWTDSGRWPERGPSGYCMARKGDAGPYAVDNVRICTVQENTAEAMVSKLWRERHPLGWTTKMGKGWRHRPECRARPYQAYICSRTLGYFETADEARQAYLDAKAIQQAEALAAHSTRSQSA